MTTPASPVRQVLPALTGGRAVAAGAVFASHLVWFTPMGAEGGAVRIVSQALDRGALGVSFFFVLSGFVLTWTWRRGTGPAAFYARRVGRIWPSHAVVWLAVLACELAGISLRSSYLGRALSLVLLQSWVPGAGVAEAVNPVAWTLSCEAFFYLTFPWVIAPLQRLDDRGRWGAMALLAAASALPFVAFFEPRGIIVSSFPAYRLTEFLLGIVMALAIRDGARRFPSLVLTVPALVAAALLSAWVHEVRGPALAAATLLMVPIVGRLAVNDLEGRTRTIGGRVARHLGEVSFAFYLVQALTATLVRRVIAPTSWVTASIGVMLWLAATYLAAEALHRWVERPVAEAVTVRVRRRADRHVAADITR